MTHWSSIDFEAEAHSVDYRLRRRRERIEVLGYPGFFVRLDERGEAVWDEAALAEAARRRDEWERERGGEK